MLINRNTRIVGKKCILIPYRKEHVLKYHNWMQSKELQELTASEPLSLDEEYAMQKSWMMDENKCTFIILDKERYEETTNEIESMIGDTNLFFATEDDRICAEAEIMVAEKWARHRGCGTEAILLMCLYGIEKLGVKQFIVKISDLNDISIYIFKRLRFLELSHSNVFQEVTLSRVVDTDWIGWVRSLVGHYVLEDESI